MKKRGIVGAFVLLMIALVAVALADEYSGCDVQCGSTTCGAAYDDTFTAQGLYDEAASQYSTLAGAANSFQLLISYCYSEHGGSPEVTNHLSLAGDDMTAANTDIGLATTDWLLAKSKRSSGKDEHDANNHTNAVGDYNQSSLAFGWAEDHVYDGKDDAVLAWGHLEDAYALLVDPESCCFPNGPPSMPGGE